MLVVWILGVNHYFFLFFIVDFLWVKISFKYCDFYVTNYAICVPFRTIMLFPNGKNIYLRNKQVTANIGVLEKQRT